MILNVEFKNHRSFKDSCHFTMEASSSETKSNNVFVAPTSNNAERLLKIAVIYGANASGKTNFIRVLATLRSVISNTTETQGGKGVVLYDPFGLDEESQNNPTEMSITFIVNDIKHIYSLTYNQDEFLTEKLIYYPKGTDAVLFERELFEETNTGYKSYKAKYGSTVPKSNIQKFTVFSNKLILSKFLYDIPNDLITPVAEYLANIHVANSYNKVMINNLWNQIRTWLSEDESRRRKLTELLSFADLGVQAFKIEESEELLSKVLLTHKKYHGDESVGEVDFPIITESYGTRMLFILGGKILQSLESGIPLLVDEMDTGFHTYISSFILELYRNERINKKNAQLILTTHDINLLNEDLLRRDQIWFTEKSKKGESELYSLSDFEGVREDSSFSKWYLANKFGAVPSIRSIEKLFADEEN